MIEFLAWQRQIMGQKKNIILCADDYGLNPGVSQGIRALVQMGRLSAVSCMVNRPGSEQEANALIQLKAPIAIGLHVNLTEAPSAFNLPTLLFKSHFRLLSKKDIKAKIEQQIEQFTTHFHRLPDFIDGHEHVHQFPILQACLLDLIQHPVNSMRSIMIRSTYPTLMVSPYRFKSWVIKHTGGIVLQQRLKQLGIPHNAAFGGIYDFSATTDYRSLFRKWLAMAPDQTLIMCHPGLHAPNKAPTSRDNEWRYFSSDAFLDDLHEHESKLASSSII